MHRPFLGEKNDFINFSCADFLRKAVAAISAFEQVEANKVKELEAKVNDSKRKRKTLQKQESNQEGEGVESHQSNQKTNVPGGRGSTQLKSNRTRKGSRAARQTNPKTRSRQPSALMQRSVRHVSV